MSDHPTRTRPDWFWLLPFALASLAVWFLVFGKALGTGYTLLDDSTINQLALRSITNEPFWPLGILYQESLQEGGRYTPVFWLWRGIMLSVFGYAPAIHHFLHLLICWIPFGGIGLYLAARLNSRWLVFLPMVLMFCFLDGAWSSIAWNLYDLSTYDPMGGALLAIAGICAAEMTRNMSNSRSSTVWYFLSVVALILAAHAKETVAAGMFPMALLLAAGAFVFTGTKRRVCAMMATGLLLAFFLFITGYRLSGAAAATSDYTSGYSLSPGVVIPNALFAGREVLRLGLFTSAILAGLWALELWRSQRHKAFPKEVLWATVSLGACMCFLAAQLPTVDLGDMTRILWVPLIFFASGGAIILHHAATFLHPARTLVVGVVCFLPLLMLPYRMISFNADYLTFVRGEWRAVLHIDAWLDDSLAEPIAIVSLGSESYYWGAYIHLANMGREVSPQVLLRVEPSDLPPTNVSRVALIGRDQEMQMFAVDMLDDSEWIETQFSKPLPVYPLMTWANIARWLTGNGDNPFHAQEVVPHTRAFERH